MRCNTFGEPRGLSLAYLHNVTTAEVCRVLVESSMETTLSGVDRRLQHRYQQLVHEHSGHAHAGAAGPRHLPGATSTKAAVQAAWRFYRNPRVTTTRLAQPLIEA